MAVDKMLHQYCAVHLCQRCILLESSTGECILLLGQVKYCSVNIPVLTELLKLLNLGTFDKVWFQQFPSE